MKWLRFPLITVVALLLCWLFTGQSAWYAVLGISFLLPFLFHKGWHSFLAAWIAGVGSWALELLWAERYLPIGRAAGVVAGIMGFGANGAITFVLTLIVAFAMGTCGVWIGMSLKQVVVRT